MKTASKKLLCFCLSLVLIFSAVAICSAQESQRKLYYNDEFVYEVNEDNTVRILYYTGKNLSGVVVPAYIDSKPVTSIGARAFYTTKVRSVIISEGIKSIGDEAFFYCTELSNVSLPSTLESTGIGVFRACTSLKNVYMHGNASLGKYMFYGCTNLSTIELPDVAYFIPEGAFSYCKSLRSVVLPQELVEICPYAFYRSGLQSVTLPHTVQCIYEKAFAESENLYNVYENGEIEYIAEDAFENCGDDTPNGYPSVTPPYDDPTSPKPPSVDGDDSTTDEEPPTNPPTNPPSDTVVTEDGYILGFAGEMADYEYTYNETVKPDFERTKQELLSLAWNVRTIGDANKDGNVNIKDATKIQRYVAGLVSENSKDFDYKNADVDTDGKVTVRDATKIQKLIAEIVLSLC